MVNDPLKDVAAAGPPDPARNWSAPHNLNFKLTFVSTETRTVFSVVGGYRSLTVAGAGTSMDLITSGFVVFDSPARNGMSEAPISQSVLDASGVVGTWVHDHWADRLALSASLAGLLGLDPEAAASGVSLAVFLDRTHPEDRIRIESYLHAVSETGGTLEAEFRTRDTRKGVRTLLMRGRIDRDPTGRTLQGRGIAIDRTETQTANLLQRERGVNRMAEHVIALRDLAQALQRPVLVERIEHLMIEIGFELARFLPEPEDEPRH